VIPRGAKAIFSGLQNAYKPYYHTGSAIERFLGRTKKKQPISFAIRQINSHFLFIFYFIWCEINPISFLTVSPYFYRLYIRWYGRKKISLELI